MYPSSLCLVSVNLIGGLDLMGKPKVLPIKDHRQKALDYWVRFCRSSDIVRYRQDMISKEKALIESDKQYPSLLDKQVYFTIAASTLGGYGLANAVDHIIADQPTAWAEVIEALSIGYLGSELRRIRREADLLLYCRSNLDDLYYIAFHAALTGLNFWEESDCLCRHLMNLWIARGIDRGLDDQEDYLNFYWYLLRAQYKNEWPSLEEISQEELKEFYPLFATVHDPSEFRAALVQYADFRLARMHEYPSQYATKRYPEMHTDALTYGPLLLFPAELLAFKAIYQRTTGKTCTLEADHPVLNPKLLNPPQGLALLDNELTRKVNTVGNEIYGESWKPNELVKVRFEEFSVN